MAIQVIESGEKTTPHIKALIYGAPGVGKTRFGATAPDVLFLDAEAGLLSVRDQHVKSVTISTFDDVVEVLSILRSGKGFPFGGKTFHPKTVVLDSLGECQSKSMDKLLKDNAKDYADQRIWGQNIETIKKVARYFRDLPLHVLYTCLETLEDVEEGQTARYKPYLYGKKTADVVMAFPDIVGRMFTQETNGDASKEKTIVTRLLVAPHPTAYTKDRSGKLPNVLTNATFADLLVYINQEGN